MNAEQYAAAYEKNFDTAVRFFQSRGVPREDAMDCVQAAWTRGWQKKQQLRNPGAILPWIISIGKNLRNTRLYKQHAAYDAHDPLFDRRLVMKVEAEELLCRVKQEDRVLLESYYFEGLTTQEIAEPAGVSAATIRLRLREARKNVLAKRTGNGLRAVRSRAERTLI